MDINTSMQATTPIRKSTDVVRVQQNKTAQTQVQNLSDPQKISAFEDYSLEISQLTKKMQNLPEMNPKLMRNLSATLLKEKNGQEEVEQLFNYGNEDERLRKRLKERIEEEFQQYNRVVPEPATILFDKDLDVTQSDAIEAAEEMKELIDVVGILAADKRVITGQPKKEDRTPTERIREQLGGYIDFAGLTPEKERSEHKTPVEAAEDAQGQLKEVTGKLINRPEEWQVEGNKPEKSEAEKGKEQLGSAIDKNGVIQRSDDQKTFPERAEERLKKLDEKMGELIDKPKELTGKEKTDEMTAAEKANNRLGNKLNSTGLNANDKEVKTPPERSEERMKKMIDKMGERIDKHEKITGEKIDDDMTLMEKAKVNMGNRLDEKGVVPDDERMKPPPEKAEEDMEKRIEMMGQLVDKPEQMTGKKDTEKMSDTEKVKELMGGRSNASGVLPDDERNKRPQEQAEEHLEKMIDKMGERIDKTEELTGQKNEEKMSVMQKAKENYGGRLGVQGVVPDELRDKSPVEESKEKSEKLQEKVGELVDKRPEITGEENREEMTEAQKANEDMGNYINKKGIAEEEERDSTHAERIEKRLEELDSEAGRLVEGDKLDEMADSRIAPLANRMGGQQQKDFVATAKRLDQTGGPNMDKYISTTNQLIEKREDEQLKNFLSGAQDQSGVALSMYLSAAAQRHLFT
ncbi:hypothetical protein MHK_002366 [Candidatus Magnetomorum sp. HK-1]|nr:hypothetical protein MHK_002366 [Candidatus Magnetomorum sp. HK-1]